MPNPKPIIAAFDFDGTLTYCDSLVPFLIQTFGATKTLMGLGAELPTFVGYLFSLRSRQETKEKILTRFMKGLDKETLSQMGQYFAQKGIPRLLKKDSLQKLRWHQTQGHRCILISASISVYLEPWASQEGFQDVLSSRLEFNPTATGRLLGLNCRGPEKTRRLLELLGPRDGFILYAYGDSVGDRELLEMADYPFKV